MSYFTRVSVSLLITFGVYVNAFAQQDTARVHYVTVSIDMPQLSKSQQLQILLPADYYTTTRRYPVLYLQDAQNIYSKNGILRNSWCVDSLLQTLPLKHQCIVVGIDHGGSARIAEYSPWDSDYAKGLGIAYTEFMVKTLKPYIDAHYRTKADAAHTAIAGSSMGGLIAQYAITKYPSIFGSAGVFSPAFWIAPKMYEMTSGANFNKRSGIFLTCGDQEGNELSYVSKMDTLLRSKNLSAAQVPDVLVMKGEKHNEHQWRLSFPAFYAWLSNRW